MFAADLRHVQAGGAHLVREFDNFAVYAAQTFDGLTAAAAKQISRQGECSLPRIRVDGDGALGPYPDLATRAG